MKRKRTVCLVSKPGHPRNLRCYYYFTRSGKHCLIHWKWAVESEVRQRYTNAESAKDEIAHYASGHSMVVDSSQTHMDFYSALMGE